MPCGWTLEQSGYSNEDGAWAGAPLTEVSVSTHRGHRASATLSHTLPAAEASAESSGGSSPQGDQLPPTAGGQCLHCGKGGLPALLCSKKRFAFSSHNAFAKIAIHRIMQYPFHQPTLLIILLLTRETHLMASQLLSVRVRPQHLLSLLTGPGTWAAMQGWAVSSQLCWML